MPTYESNIILGAKYRDRQTGLEGHAVVVSFHQHSCERVVLESTDADVTDIKMWEFDAVRLVCLEPQKVQPEPVPTGATVGKPVRAGRRP